MQRLEDFSVIFRVRVKLHANMSYADGNMLACVMGLSVDHKFRILARQWLKDPEIVFRFQEGARYLCLLQVVYTGGEAHLT